MVTPIAISHFSDVLCVWAYAGQRRMDKLVEEFGEGVAIDYRLTSIFGFARDKLEERWKDKGGLAGYSQHVRDVIGKFDHVELHPDVWVRVAPRSSLPAHLALSAIRVLVAQGAAPPTAFATTAWRLRQAFFREARDISRDGVLREVLADAGLDHAAIAEQLTTGAAHAALARDDHQARELDVRMSPTIVMGEGRQHLKGNVGYRVIAANVRELIERPAHQASWC